MGGLGSRLASPLRQAGRLTAMQGELEAAKERRRLAEETLKGLRTRVAEHEAELDRQQEAGMAALSNARTKLESDLDAHSAEVLRRVSSMDPSLSSPESSEKPVEADPRSDEDPAAKAR